MLSLWGAVGLESWSSNYQPQGKSYASFERVSFKPDGTASAVQGTVSVGSISGAAYASGRGWRAVSSVLVRSAAGKPVADVVVSGSFTNGGSALQCRTKSDGTCSISSEVISRRKTSTLFSINQVTASGLTYDAKSNSVSSLIIARP